jgi:ketosteroid isomerase-like protein
MTDRRDQSINFITINFSIMRPILCLLVLCSAFGLPSLAQTKEETAVTAAVESLRKALIDPDKATLDRLVLDELTYGHSSGMIQDKAAFEEALLSKSSDFVTIDLTLQTVKVAGNAAWVRHILTATTNDGGKPGQTKLSVLLVWEKQKGEWRLLARQAVKVLP